MKNISAQVTAMKIAFVLVDTECRVLAMSEKAQEIFNCVIGQDLFLGAGLRYINETYGESGFERDIRQHLADGLPCELEVGITASEINVSWHKAKLIPYKQMFILYLEDINELIGARRLNRQLTQQDPHTGLLYREAFIRKVKEQGLSGTVCCVRICDYQKLNEIWGTAVANLVFMEMLARVQTEWEFAICSKHSTDSFNVFIDCAHDFDIQALYDRLNEPFQFNKHSFYSNIALGYYEERDGDDLEQSMNKAEMAILDVLENRERLVEFQDQFARQIEQQSRLENAFRRALSDNELEQQFSVVIQPIHDEVNQRVAGGECLMRWVLDGEFIPPPEFIPIAERLGEISKLTRLNIRAVAQLVGRLKAAGMDYDGYVFALNISVVELLDVEFVDSITDSVYESGLAPEMLKIELTESAFISNFTYVNTVLKQLQLRGFRVSIDDFGTGYSSLSYLCRLSFDEIKIDRAFVTEVITDKRIQSVFNAVLLLAQNLDKPVVAEGVEDVAQLHFARDKGVQYIQGYYYSRPLSPDDFIAYLQEHNRG